VVGSDPGGWIFKHGSNCRAELGRCAVGDRDAKAQLAGEVVVSKLEVEGVEEAPLLGRR
jgi:hypothetical protein